MSPNNTRPRFVFEPAVREHAKARVALVGPAGSGKSLSAIKMASALGQRIALICSERGSARKHAGNVYVHGEDGNIVRRDSYSARASSGS